MPNELVLVVDDEPDILRLCERILSGEGYIIYTASTGSQAIKIARETPFDVVLVDLKMPDKDGLTIFETIRQYNPDSVGLVITGYPSMEAAIDALKQGMSGFILKPFTPNELRQAVVDALNRRRLERDHARLKALIPLYELSRSLMTTTDIDVLLNQAVEMAVQETGADRASLMLERDGMLYIEAAYGLPVDVMDTTATPVGEGIAGWVAQHGEPLLLERNVPMPSELKDALTREDIASAVCVPLALQDRVIGVLNLTKLEPTERPFTPSDRDLITVLAGQVAIAIENARLFQRQQAMAQELSRTNANLRALQQAATAITSRLNPEHVLQTTLDGCATVMDDATIALGLLDPDMATIEVHLHHRKTRRRETVTLTLQPEEVQAIESRSGAEKVLEERLSRLITERAGPASIGVIPLAVRDQLLGAMAVGTERELTEDELTTLAPFADQAAVAISNAQLFARFQQAHRELQELNRLKSEFLNIAAYGLHSLLGVIERYTELLRTTTPERLKPELSKLLDTARELEAYINNLARLRDLEAATSGPPEEPVPVERVITSLVDRLGPLAQEKGLHLQVELPEEVRTVRVDRTKLEIIMANLMQNAIEFTRPGGTVGIRARLVENNDLHIAVWDTGPGIPAAEQAQIFEQPYQESGLPTFDLNGAGLGLSVAQRLAEEYDGRIELESKPGEGSTFTLVLPGHRLKVSG